MSKQDTRKIGWSADTAHMMEGLVGKTKKQLRAEAVERLKEARYHSASDHLCAVLDWGHEPHTGEEAHEALIDLLTDDDGDEVADTREHMGNGESVPICANDAREQLEAWAHEEIAEKWAQSDREVTMIMDDLLDMLDRQAAITRKECEHPNWDYCETCEALAELTAERDQYKRNAKILADKAQQYRDERDKYDVLAVNAELWKDERDEMQEAIDAMGNGQFYAMYKAKCEECEQLKKVARTQAESFKKLECELAGKQ